MQFVTQLRLASSTIRGGCGNNNSQARKPAVVSVGRYSVGYGSAAYGPSRTSKPTRAPGALPRRYVVPHPWDKQARFNRRRRLAWLFPDAQPSHHRAVRKSTNRSKRPRRTLNQYAVEVGPSNATREALRWDSLGASGAAGALGLGSQNAPLLRRDGARLPYIGYSRYPARQLVGRFIAAACLRSDAERAPRRSANPEGSITLATKPQSSICGARVLTP
jgi:hypothetical protein